MKTLSCWMFLSTSVMAIQMPMSCSREGCYERPEHSIVINEGRTIGLCDECMLEVSNEFMHPNGNVWGRRFAVFGLLLETLVGAGIASVAYVTWQRRTDDWNTRLEEANLSLEASRIEVNELKEKKEARLALAHLCGCGSVSSYTVENGIDTFHLCMGCINKIRNEVEV